MLTERFSDALILPDTRTINPILTCYNILEEFSHLCGLHELCVLSLSKNKLNTLKYVYGKKQLYSKKVQISRLLSGILWILHKHNKNVRSLATQLRNGLITAEQYAAAVNALRVTDSSGRWWQPNPQGEGWLVWDGKAWQVGSPESPGTCSCSSPASGGFQQKDPGDEC